VRSAGAVEGAERAGELALAADDRAPVALELDRRSPPLAQRSALGDERGEFGLDPPDRAGFG